MDNRNMMRPVKRVRMYGYDAREWCLVNVDGVTSVMSDPMSVSMRQVLQARSAFDGMVNCMMQLFGFELVEVAYEDYEEGGSDD